jgi:hypothetical protein
MRQFYKRPFTALVLTLVASVAGAQAIDETGVIELAQAQGGDAAVAAYDQLLKEVEGLEVYNDLLQRQIEAQAREIVEFQEAIVLVPELERQVPPLLLRMVTSLEDFVERDLPFLSEERADRVADLQLLVERSDVTNAEKFRRILEAWQIETEYGSAYTAYRGQVDIGGISREADFLQVGRIGLLYQTTDDAADTAAWDVRNGGWLPLGIEHRNSIRVALRMANNQVAPDLVLLPLSPPE